MSLTSGFVSLFVNAFGITKPDARQERRIAVFLALGLLAVIALLGLVAFTLFRMLG